MIFPYLVLLVSCLAILGYFARKNVTWTKQVGTQGSIGMALIVFIIAALIGWGLDIWVDWSVIPQYMFVAGGALQIIAIAFFAGLTMLCLSMLSSAAKVGTMVA